VGLFEYLQADNGLRELITQKAQSRDIGAYAVKTMKMATMRDDGLAKAKNKITTIEEVDRAQLPE